MSSFTSSVVILEGMVKCQLVFLQSPYSGTPLALKGPSVNKRQLYDWTHTGPIIMQMYVIMLIEIDVHVD